MKPFLFNSKKIFLLHGLSAFLLLASSFLSYAKAGDISSRHILGFSQDGTYFAMEEYGVQDGSGFPYSTVFIINTKTNSWVKKTPIRVLIEDESYSLKKTRKQALDKALPLLQALKIDHSGQLLAHNPVTELGPSSTEVKVAPGNAPFLKNYALTFNVSRFPIPTKRCKDYGAEAQMGYKLEVSDKTLSNQILHEDKRIPTSRGCPKNYRISDIIQYRADFKTPKTLYIVLLQVFSYGFEGNDGRFLATSHWLASYNASN